MNSDFHVFAGATLDRMSAKRIDAAWVAEQAAAPTSKFVLFNDLKVLARLPDDGRKLVHFSPAEINATGGGKTADPVFLGLDEYGAAYFATAIPNGEGFEPHGEFCDLRALAIEGIMPHDQLATAGQAKALIDWHARHGFCSTCGTADNMEDGGYKRKCPSCGRMHFPRVDPVVIMLAYRGDKCLLGRSPNFIPGMYSALAGFMEPGETFEEAVRREIQEEVGVVIDDVHYHSSQPWPFPSSIMTGFMAHAASEEIMIDPVEIEAAQWFTREEARQTLDGTHPEGIRVPFRMAIAYHLLKSFVDGDMPK